MISTAALILQFSAMAFGEQFGNFTDPCKHCGDVCSTVPPPNASNPLCYQGAPEDTTFDYNTDPANPTDSMPTCDTCATFNYSFYVRNDPVYINMELWSNVNPLCSFAAATNIADLVRDNKMQGWDCNSEGRSVTDYCDGWTGVTCTPSSPMCSAPCNSTVMELDLPALDITGSIPDDFTELYYLQSLNLTTNKLEGSVLASLVKMPLLQYIDVSGNKFTGSIADDFGSKVPSLQSFLLQDNRFTGVVPPSLGSLVNVTAIDISSNKFEGVIPAELCNDAKLTSLGFAHESPLFVCYADCLDAVPGLTLDAGEYPACAAANVTSSFFPTSAPSNMPTTMPIEVMPSSQPSIHVPLPDAFPPTSMPTATAQNDDSSSSNSLSGGALIGVAVGSSVAGVVLIAVLLYFFGGSVMQCLNGPPSDDDEGDARGAAAKNGRQSEVRLTDGGGSGSNPIHGNVKPSERASNASYVPPPVPGSNAV